MNIFNCECPLLLFPFHLIDFQLLCRKLHHMWHLSSVCSLPHLHSAAVHRMWPAVSLPFRTVHTHQDPCDFLKSHKTAQVSTEQSKCLREHVCVEDFVKQICVFNSFLSSSLSTWQCKYCTTVNTMQQVLCETCERPRLSSSAPSLQEEPSQPSTISG